jgi:hypothetical protein
LSQPRWVVEAKTAENRYSRRDNAYRVATGVLFILMAITLLDLGYAGQFKSAEVPVIGISFLVVIFTIASLQRSLVPPPSTPTYQRLAAVIYLISDCLGRNEKAEKKNLGRQLDVLESLIAEQEPEFKKKDLVFGMAVSVLGRLREIRKKLSGATKSGIPQAILPTVQSGLQALANMIFLSKTINAGDIDTLADTLMQNMAVIPSPAPRPVLEAISERLSGLSGRQTLLMEAIVSLLIGTAATLVSNIGFFGGVILSLAVFACLDAVERKLRQKP